MTARALENVVRATDVAVEDLLPRTFERCAAHVNDGITALGRSHGCGLVAEIEHETFLVVLQILHCDHVGQHEFLGQRCQTTTQFRSKTASRTGDQNFLKRFAHKRLRVSR